MPCSIKTEDYEGGCRRHSTQKERADWFLKHGTGNGVRKRFMAWVAGLVATGIAGAMGYLSYGAIERSERVPIIEERLSNHIQIIDGRMRKVEDGVEFLVRREMERGKK